MKLLVVRADLFERGFPDVVGDEIGLVKRNLLKQDVYTFCWDEDLDRDDQRGGVHELAQTLHLLKQRLETVRLDGQDGIYIGGEYDVWVESVLVEDIRRIERHPELSHSMRCYEAFTWFTTMAEVHTL